VAFRDASSLLEKSGCVTGLVLRVYTSRGRNTFLDFCPDYRTCPFTSVIFASDRSVFGDPNALTGRQVEIRGVVQAYEGRAEIIIRDPQQIRVLP
jgi:DNA/RNA endonuclease YhcR with UshA esterase domain